MSTKVMGSFAKETGKQYLVDILKPLCEDLLSSNESLEVDPNVLAKSTVPQNVDENMRNLKNRCKQFIDRVFYSVDNIPGSFKYICYILRFYVRQKWPLEGEGPWVTAVAGFFFLRFLCPPIVTPDAHGVIDAPPSADGRRKLLLIAKVIQHLANNASFKGKEIYLDPLNDWVTTFSQGLSEFLDKISIAPSGYVPFTIIPKLSGLEVLQALETLKLATKMKLKKTIKLLEEEEARKNNAIIGEPTLFIRDFLLFSGLMDSYDWGTMIRQTEPNWIPKGVSQQAVQEIIERDNLYLEDDPEIAIDKIWTLNFWYDPEDQAFLETEEKKKEKERGR